ncbi:MAG: hypothetical protein RQ715_11480 [Methylococcales bacterium]|nr:hypothetical protein [Methylococcales bacterium]
MIEPVALEDFFVTFFSSALIILTGAGYAACWAGYQLTVRRVFLGWAVVCYLGLLAALWVLTRAAHFQGHWQWLTWILATGYLLAPILIGRLTAGTHTSTKNNRGEPHD